jgi:adenylate cyclase
LTLDPQSVEAHALLARTLAARAMDGLTNSAEADITRAERLVWQALAASPRSPLAHYARGQVLRAQGRCEEAIPEYETALASNRNWVEALANIGRCKFLIGSIEEAIAAQEQAIRLSPRDPQIGVWCHRIGQVHLLQSRVDEAILWFEKARSANPRLPFVRAFLASAYALKGESGRASAELAEARRLSGGGRFLSIAHSKNVFDFGVPKVRALYEATYFAGLRKAGMPEE